MEQDVVEMSAGNSLTAQPENSGLSSEDTQEIDYSAFPGHPIVRVLPDSIAEELEIEPGDVLLAVNDEPVEDVFDYRFMIRDEYVEVLIRKPDGEEWLLEVDKEYEDDLGIEFENDLMSDCKSCRNKCIFCFIDQMPPGMRETLYFKDDDSRLSFLQGNYITMTNMTQKDVDRIVRFHLGPINISVQATNPKLRKKMLNNRFADKLFGYLDTLYEGHIEMNGQIVLCKNVNDGEELKRSITDLSRYLPFLRSVSVVPSGVTKFREGLYPLEAFTKEDACEVIDLVEGFQKKYYEEYGLHFIHASDEFYLLAERDFPEEERYDGYIQLENGVGMMRLFMEEFSQACLEAVEKYKKSQSDKDVELPVGNSLNARSAIPQPMIQTNMENIEKQAETQVSDRVTDDYEKRHISIATGKLAYPVICEAARQMMDSFPWLTIQVFCIRNDFFGETITVAGLITGQDLIGQLKREQEAGTELGTHLYIPSCMLRTGENVFLDDLTTEDVERKLQLSLVPIESGGSDFVQAMLYSDYHMERVNDRQVYVKAYES